MAIRGERRADALAHIARHILDQGLPGASLRSLAASAGVSDRMLLYYFADKNEMLTAALGVLALQMATVLDQSVPQAPKRAFAILLGEIRQAIQGAAMRPYMTLWLEIAARAARHEPPYGTIAGIIADGFENWVTSRLDATDPNEAARLLATIEGLVILDAVGRPNLADAASRGA